MLTEFDELRKSPTGNPHLYYPCDLTDQDLGSWSPGPEDGMKYFTVLTLSSLGED